MTVLTNSEIQSALDNVSNTNAISATDSSYSDFSLSYSAAGNHLLTFDNCTFTGTGHKGCHISSNGVSPIQNITFNNCTFQDVNLGSSNKNYAYGLLIDNKLASAQGKVSGITVTDCSFNNIGAATGAAGATNGGGGIGSLGISIHELKESSAGSANITIKNNTFTNIYSGMPTIYGGFYDVGLLTPAVAIQLAREPYLASLTAPNNALSTVSGINVTKNNITLLQGKNANNSGDLTAQLIHLRTLNIKRATNDNDVRVRATVGQPLQLDMSGGAAIGYTSITTVEDTIFDDSAFGDLEDGLTSSIFSDGTGAAYGIFLTALLTPTLGAAAAGAAADLVAIAPSTLKTAAGHTGSAGDPYITPLEGPRFKLPNKACSYRLYVNGNTFVNARVSATDNDKKEAIMNYYNRITKGRNNMKSSKKLIVDGFFYDAFFIGSGDKGMFIDLKKGDFCSNVSDFFRISSSEKTYKDSNFCGSRYKKAVVAWDNEEFGEMSINIKFYINPQIDNGISISSKYLMGSDVTGLLVKNYSPDIMELPSVTTLEHDDIHNKLSSRMVSGEGLYSEGGVVLKNEFWAAGNFASGEISRKTNEQLS